MLITLTVELTFYFWIFLLYLSSSLNKVEEIFSFMVIISIAQSLNFAIPAPLCKIFILKYISICFYKLTNGIGSKKTIIALVLSQSQCILSCIYSLFLFLFDVFLAVSGRLKMLNLKPLVFLGSISYSLYLLHQNIGYIIINKAYDLQLNPLVGISSAIFVSVVLARFFYEIY